MNSALYIGERLREERQRLKMTQAALASFAGASKRTAIEWEKGATSPNAVQLSALSEYGVDIGYVLTGHRRVIENQLQDRTAMSELIDPERMARIASMLEDLAKAAGKRWPPGQLINMAVEVYNFLAQESDSVDDKKMERVLKLVVNR